MSTNRGSIDRAESVGGDGVSVSMKVAEVFFPYFSRLFEDRKIVDNTSDNLTKANINVPAEMFLSAAFGYGAIFGFFIGSLIAAPVVILMEPSQVDPASLPLSGTFVAEYMAVFLTEVQPISIALAIVAFFVFLSAVVGTVAATYYPKSVKRSRRREINALMPTVTTFMYSLSLSGTNQLQLIRAVAEADSTLGEASTEFRRIALEIDYFNTSYHEAVEQVARTTPSDQLQEFFLDMLSVIDSGGDITDWLETQKESARSNAKSEAKERLDTLEVFGQMYLVLNIIPIGGVIFVVFMSIMEAGVGIQPDSVLQLIVYGVIPGINVIFVVLVASVKKDRFGKGILPPSDSEGSYVPDNQDQITTAGIVNRHVDETNKEVFGSIRRQEIQHRITRLFREPLSIFLNRPRYILIVTIPMTIISLITLLALDIAEFGVSPMVEQPILQSFIWLYIPLLINIIPLSLFYEHQMKTRGKVTDALTEQLQKLANANETGQPIIQALYVSAVDQNTLLADEFKEVYKKTEFGVPLSTALIEANNKYKTPRLARVVRLIEKASESSENISEVLRSTAENSKDQDQIEREHKQRTQSIIVIGGMTFLVFVAIIAVLDAILLEQLVAEDGEGFDTGIDPSEADVMSMLFFHGAIIQGFATGIVSGYVQSGRFSGGFKYAIGYLIFVLLAFTVIHI